MIKCWPRVVIPFCLQPCRDAPTVSLPTTSLHAFCVEMSFYYLLLFFIFFNVKHFGQAITFLKCKNLIMRNLKVQDAQKMHVSFQNCMNVRAYNLFVTAPETSPNTDGIHVTSTQKIQISNSVIGTGII